MSNSNTFENYSQLQQWYQGIATANRNNIFCHCRQCGFEWVDSSIEVMCSKCSSQDVEHISCWQFPDD